MDPGNVQASKPPAVKVLLVEDDNLIQEMYETILKLRNFEVELASDGVEGLEKTRALKPDVILLDVMMPKMNGLEMLEKLKNDPQIRDIPVIMLSNLADDEHIRQALSLGALQYIIKSEHVPKEIADMVEQTLASHNAKPPIDKNPLTD